jgi:hypothetical protein
MNKNSGAELRNIMKLDYSIQKEATIVIFIEQIKKHGRE